MEVNVLNIKGEDTGRKVTLNAVSYTHLDVYKRQGYYMAFKGGLSFNLGDLIIPKEKEELVKRGNEEVEQIMMHYNMGFITDNERYNQVIDTWTHVHSDLSDILYKTIKNDDQGVNSVLMMLDSGARGSKAVSYTQLIDVRLGVDPRKANQMVRGVVSLPHGTGKQVRVLRCV